MIESIQINIPPILEVEQEDTLQANTPNTIAAMLNSSISHNRTISDFNPHECLSDE